MVRGYLRSCLIPFPVPPWVSIAAGLLLSSTLLVLPEEGGFVLEGPVVMPSVTCHM